MTGPVELSGAKPRLYHAPSSYYSMIARLALAEAGIAYEPVFLDIHVRKAQQQPDYARFNPNMTVPTLVTGDGILDESRDIAEHAFGVGETTLDRETRDWLDRHYALPIEQLTFGRLLAGNRLARIMIPRYLDATRRRLLARAKENPDLARVYEARAEAFAERCRVFDPVSVAQVAQQRCAQAIDLMERLEQTLGDGRSVIVPPAYGVADVVFTVFLARMEFAGLGAEIPRRPALARYWRAVQARPSFAAADIWTRFHPLRLIGGILGLSQGRARSG